MATVVYGLCFLTSAACAVLLLRSYARTRVMLLFWSGLCFVGLALNNLILVIGVRVVPDVDLSSWRTIPALLGVCALLYGMISEATR
jgi:hypothetical protein